MRMPPPPGRELGTKDRLFAWIGRHRLASALIGIFGFLLIVSAISNSAGGITPPDQAAPTSAAPTAAPRSPSKPPQPELAKVPTVQGLSAQQARSSLRYAGFSVTIVQKYSARAPGTLLTMSADAGTKMEVGSSVSITAAKPYPTVPYVLGLTQDEATSKLKSAGYNVVVNKQESSQTSGTVISVDPAAGTDRVPGRSVTVVVAKAPPPPPPPSNCTPGYSPCLPPASDYDCAGGSGNGPAYTEPGVTYRVTGYDPYGLDADNDGYGCE
jgi:resuscitation-promoting factor RpfB